MSLQSVYVNWITVQSMLHFNSFLTLPVKDCCVCASMYTVCASAEGAMIHGSGIVSNP